MNLWPFYGDQFACESDFIKISHLVKNNFLLLLRPMCPHAHFFAKPNLHVMHLRFGRDERVDGSRHWNYVHVVYNSAMERNMWT